MKAEKTEKKQKQTPRRKRQAPWKDMKDRSGKSSYVACVIANDGTPLMPCTNPRKVRRSLDEGRAKIVRRADPFTIQLLYESEKNTQPIELCEDTGYLNVGLSVKSEKHEYVHEELKLLPDEKEKHMAQKAIRRQRRNRKRYRKPRFKNRKSSRRKKEKAGETWLAPSLDHKVDAHVSRAERYIKNMPITSIVLEIGKFDTALMEALENGRYIEGAQYQMGLKHMKASQRLAIFERDNYTCQICKKNAFKDHVILCLHHIGYRHHDRSNRASNLLTVCTHCHSPANHKEGGKLWDLEPAGKLKSDAAFMNTVRYAIQDKFKKKFPNIPVSTTYGAITAVERKLLNLPKTHTNDAYAMGEFHPKHRAYEKRFSKRRRNNRVIERFYDAVFIDIRDGSKKKGAELPSGRVKRNKNLNTENLRIYRGEKVKKGFRSIRRKRYSTQSGDIMMVNGKKRAVYAVHNLGVTLQYKDEEGQVRGRSHKMVKVIRHADGWIQR